MGRINYDEVDKYGNNSDTEFLKLANDVEEADADEHDYHQQFQKYDEVVEARTALRAAGKDEREEHHDGYGGHVDDTAHGGARRECSGQRQTDIVHHHAKIATPRNG